MTTNRGGPPKFSSGHQDNMEKHSFILVGGTIDGSAKGHGVRDKS